MNTSFADIVSDALVFAPDMLTIDRRTITAPTADDYAKAGYWPITETHPDPVSGKHEVEGTPTKVGETKTREELQPVPLTEEEEAENQRRMDEWEAAGAQGDPPELIYHDPVPVTVEYTVYKIYRVWTLVDDAPVYRKFSKLKIYGAIAQLGAWATVQTWLEGKTVEGLNGWTAFQLAQEISEDHALFASLAEEARQLLGLSTEQFETLLNACILED